MAASRARLSQSEPAWFSRESVSALPPCRQSCRRNRAYRERITPACARMENDRRVVFSDSEGARDKRAALKRPQATGLPPRPWSTFARRRNAPRDKVSRQERSPAIPPPRGESRPDRGLRWCGEGRWDGPAGTEDRRETPDIRHRKTRR